MSQITCHHLRCFTRPSAFVRLKATKSVISSMPKPHPVLDMASEYCLPRHLVLLNWALKKLEGHVTSLVLFCPRRILLICDISGSRASSHGSLRCPTVISLTPTPGRPSYHWRPDNQEIMRVLGTNALSVQDYYCTRLILTPQAHTSDPIEREMVIKILKKKLSIRFFSIGSLIFVTPLLDHRSWLKLVSILTARDFYLVCLFTEEDWISR